MDIFPDEILCQVIITISSHLLHIHPRVMPGKSKSWHQFKFLFPYISHDDISIKNDQFELVGSVAGYWWSIIFTACNNIFIIWGACTQNYDFVFVARIIAILKKRGKFAQRIYCIFYICFDSRSLIANHVKWTEMNYEFSAIEIVINYFLCNSRYFPASPSLLIWW